MHTLTVAHSKAVKYTTAFVVTGIKEDDTQMRIERAAAQGPRSCRTPVRSGQNKRAQQMRAQQIHANLAPHFLGFLCVYSKEGHYKGET